MDRAQLKLAGKKNFEKNKRGSIVACLPITLPNFIMMIASLVLSVILAVEIFKATLGNLNSYSYSSSYSRSNQPMLNEMSNISQYMSWIWIIISAIFLSVLIKKFFLMNRMQSSCKASVAFSSFKGSEYLKIVGNMFFISLWLIVPNIIKYFSSYFDLYFSLLFSILSSLLLILGIIKFYFSYFMVPYILAENPNIGVKRAVAISKYTMKGAKWDLFVFNLSFIGWKLLSGLTLGILDIFDVIPYLEASKAEFYCNMKQKAKSMKICSADELP